MEDTLKITKKMKKMIKTNEVNNTDLLRYLDYLKDMDMTLEILTKSGIGLVINQLRRLSDDPEVSRAGKGLIKAWRSLVPASSGSPDSPSDTHASNGIKRKHSEDSEDGGVVSSSKMNKQSDSTDSHKKKDSTPSFARQESAGQVLIFRKNHETGNTVRLKSREMLQKALEAGDVPEDAYDPEYLAVEIEVAIFKEFKDTDTKYKNRLRSRVMNLRDKNNPGLRINVLMGHVPANKFAKMSAEEMASDEMKKLRENMTQQAINEHQLAVSAGTETSLIRCGKCGQNKCTYTQLQTRSSDEPMTTFVYCSTCGHRFKFN